MDIQICYYTEFRLTHIFMGFIWVLRFSLTSQKPAGRWNSVSKMVNCYKCVYIVLIDCYPTQDVFLPHAQLSPL